MAPPPPRPPPHLMPELIVEILLRFPPDHPAFLVRASVVCKTWRHLLCDPSFRRQYVAFHRTPPLLGFLHKRYPNTRGYYLSPRIVSTTTPSPLPLRAFDYFYHRRCCSVLDCRHGRVLLEDNRYGSVSLVVWDLATGKQKWMPQPPLVSPQLFDYSAAVLCAVRDCDHLDCHGDPFRVVLVDYNIQATEIQSHSYSSEARTWSSSACQGPGIIVPACKPSVLIGNDIYFVPSSMSVAILKVDLTKNHLSIINRPEVQQDFEGNVVLMAMEDGSLGFAGIQSSRLCLWSRNVNAEVVCGDVVPGWMQVQCSFIELQTLIPFTNRLLLVGSAEGCGVIFVATDVGVFSLELKSGHVKKVDEPLDDFVVFPFMSFYTPGGSNSVL